jgi:hypothetical protein
VIERYACRGRLADAFTESGDDFDVLVLEGIFGAGLIHSNGASLAASSRRSVPQLLLVEVLKKAAECMASVLVARKFQPFLCHVQERGPNAQIGRLSGQNKALASELSAILRPIIGHRTLSLKTLPPKQPYFSQIVPQFQANCSEL